MAIHLSRFGYKITQSSGIMSLMDDMGKALSGKTQIHMLGGGNPAHIPKVNKLLQQQLQAIANDSVVTAKMLGDYSGPQGNEQFLDAICEFLQQHYNWDIDRENITVVGGSQTAFFFLFNILAGEMSDKLHKKILLPITPEYIGYSDQGLHDDLFIAVEPQIQYFDNHDFKYQVDFSRLEAILVDRHREIGAICLSRPTNPTGNVITDAELKHLASLALQYEIPLIIDNAYGLPFPQIIFTEAHLHHDANTVNVMSFSKLGLPGARNSIVVASKSIIRAITSLNAIVSLSSPNLAQYLTLPLIVNNEILKISQDIIKPFYQNKAKKSVNFFKQVANPKLPYHLHVAEGSIFLWLYCQDLPISSLELYNRLKKAGVLVVPGEYFFAGAPDHLPQRHECLRISYAQADATVEQGLHIIAQEMEKAYYDAPQENAL